MKENVFDVLMYLFEHYMDGELDLKPDQESLKMELMEVGFRHGEISKAFNWLEGLSLLRENTLKNALTSNYSIRIFTAQEKRKLDMNCRGFLLYLEQVGILDAATRELAIDRVMALESDEIDLDQLKWVILMVLFNQPGQEAAYAWMEDLVFDEVASNIH